MSDDESLADYDTGQEELDLSRPPLKREISIMSERHASNAVKLLLDLGAAGFKVKAWHDNGTDAAAIGYTLADALRQIAARVL